MTQSMFLSFKERVELEKQFKGENVEEVDNIKSLLNKTVQWAEDRNLIKGSDSKSQCLKLVQEVGELSDSICKGKSPIDDIGDCLVVLTILAKQSNLTLEECLAHAYNDIKDRKGKMVDGVFVKESDYA